MRPSNEAGTYHVLKTWTEYLEAVWDGRKKHVNSKGDRRGKIGEYLVVSR